MRILAVYKYFADENAVVAVNSLLKQTRHVQEQRRYHGGVASFCLLLECLLRVSYPAQFCTFL